MKQGWYKVRSSKDDFKIHYFFNSIRSLCGDHTDANNLFTSRAKDEFKRCKKCLKIVNTYNDLNNICTP